MMYSLRSKRRQDFIEEINYMNFSPGNKTCDKEMKIALTRVPILENQVNHDKTFFVKKDGNISIKGKVDSRYNWKNIYYTIVVAVLVLILTAFYFKGECQEFGRGIAKRTAIFPSKRLKPLLNNLNLFIGNSIYALKYKWSGHTKYSDPRKVKQSHKRKKFKRKSGVCYNNLEDLILNYVPDVRAADYFKAQTQLSFIEEQCRLTKKEPKLADNFNINFNSSKSFDIDSLPDFASLAKGGRILSNSNAEPYLEIKLRSWIFQYISGLEYLNIDHFPICGLSSRLCQFFVAGLSSILQPWVKPGDCWSFKGSNGRLQIELSDRIYITAISLEHIPLKLASPAQTSSAPKVFSVIGIDDSEGHGFTSRIHLGTYEYRLAEPNIQTFSLSVESSSHPYKIIEFIVESNHGNKNYTCVYRLRVHGNKYKSV